MIDYLSKHSAETLLESNLINEDDYDVYFYGMQIIYSTIIKVGAILLISFILGIFLEMVIFITCFGLMRNYAGGRHMDSYLACFITTLLLGLVPIYSVLYIPYTKSIVYLIITCILSILIIMKLSPVETPNKPIYDEHRAVLKKSSIIASIVLSCLIIIIYLLDKELIIYCSIASSALLVEALTLLPIFNRTKNQVEEVNK